jgi:aminoglycoside/choline kinase family phosphotransferase
MGFNAAYRLAAGRVDAFVAVAGHLRRLGLSAPEVRAFDAEAGLAVLEDLGDDLFAPLLAGGADERMLYEAALDVLLAVHRAPAPDLLNADGVRWPLLSYDDLALRTASDLLVDWLPRLLGAPPFSEQARAEWEAFWAPVRARGEAGAEVFCHRDYHAENLIWLPERAGPARVGLLDFQDAVRAHRAWDLSMLLHDARRDISPELRRAVLERYLREEPQLDRETFLRDFHALGGLNVVRIIGIFSRLIERDGKPRYRQFLPRMWGYLDECCAAPGMEGLRAWFDRHAPDRMLEAA